MRRLATALASFALVAGVAACGVAEESAPRFRDPAELPFGLDEQPATTTTRPVAGQNPSVVCLVDADGTVVRQPGPSGARLLMRLRATPGDRPDLTTALPDPEMVADAAVRQGVAEIELRPDFTELPAPTQRLIAAQSVCTATATQGVGQVRFTIDSAALSVPRGDGSLSAERLTLDDYLDLLGDAP